MLSVLLIDDEPGLLEMIKLMAERSREMTVQTAQSAKEALKIIDDKSFDAIILDYDMPEINGIEFLKILRSKGDSTPVIIFTGAGREHTVIEALNNGANFYVKKTEDPLMQFRELVSMAKKAVEQNFSGRSVGTSQRTIADMINFSSDPSFAIDRDGKVIAWNDSMEQLTDTPATSIVGKGDLIYSVPFFGVRKKMLANLVFDTDDEIKREKYMLVSKVAKGTVIGVTRGQKRDGSDWTLWMKSKPIYDSHGKFIAVVGTVRDVTATFGDIPDRETPSDSPESPLMNAAPAVSPKPAKGLLKKILGKAIPHYKEGIRLYIHEAKYAEAITEFDYALEIDEKFPFAWNDRGICYRELGDHTNALKSHLRAVELAPENPELLFNLGETLEMIGVLYMSNKYLDSAIQTFKMVANLLPNNAGTWNHIGVCYKVMGKADESRFYFDRARDIKAYNKDTPLTRKRDEYL